MSYAVVELQSRTFHVYLLGHHAMVLVCLARRDLVRAERHLETLVALALDRERATVKLRDDY